MMLGGAARIDPCRPFTPGSGTNTIHSYQCFHLLTFSKPLLT